MIARAGSAPWWLALRPWLVAVICLGGGALAGVQATRDSPLFPGPVFGIAVAAILLRFLAEHVRRHPDRAFVARIVTLGALTRLVLAGAHLFIGFVVYRGAIDFLGYLDGARDLLFTYIPAGEFAPFDPGWVDAYYRGMPSMATSIAIAVMRLFVGDSVAGMFLVTACFGVIGAYLYFRAYEIACPGSEGRRFLGWTLFLLPSVAFWSIFLGKDVFVFLGLACATYALIRILIQSRWGCLPLLVAGLGLVFIIRPPIAVCFTAAAVVAMALRPWRARGPDAYLAPVGRIVMVLALGVVGYTVAGQGLLRIGVASLTVDALAERAAVQQQGFATTEGGAQLSATLDSSDPASVALSVPYGVMTVLFRPFVWEAHNALALVASIENLVLLAMVVWRLKPIARSLAAMARQPFWVFVALAFLSITVAVSFQWNLGAAARLRTMALPFLLLLAAGPGPVRSPRPVADPEGAPAPAGAPPPSRPGGGGARGFLDYGRSIWRARWALLAAGAVAGLTAFWVTLSIPKVYAAKVTATSPPARRTIEAGGAASLSASGLSLAVATGDQDLFRAVLRSRRVVDEVLGAFEKARGAEVRARIVRIVPEDLTRQVKGAFVLVAEARDPELAADVANYYIVGLNRLLLGYAEQVTDRRREALAVQLARAALEIERAEAALLKFQDEHRRLVVADKGETWDRGKAREEIRQLELAREVLRLRFTDAAPEVRVLDKQITETKRRYAKILYGHAMGLPPVGSDRTPRREFFVPGAEAATVDFAFRKLERQRAIQEAFYVSALHGLQELAYGRQTAALGAVTILDPAVPPSTHVSPSIGWNVAGAVTATVVAGALVALFLDYVVLLRRRERERTVAA